MTIRTRGCIRFRAVLTPTTTNQARKPPSGKSASAPGPGGGAASNPSFSRSNMASGSPTGGGPSSGAWSTPCASDAFDAPSDDGRWRCDRDAFSMLRRSCARVVSSASADGRADVGRELLAAGCGRASRWEIGVGEVGALLIVRCACPKATARARRRRGARERARELPASCPRASRSRRHHPEPISIFGVLCRVRSSGKGLRSQSHAYPAWRIATALLPRSTRNWPGCFIMPLLVVSRGFPKEKRIC
jgi:hypothetical protein